MSRQSKRCNSNDSGNDHVYLFFLKLTWSERFLLLGAIPVLLSIGINLTRIEVIREFFSVELKPTVEIRTVEVPAERNPQLDKKIEQWIDLNEQRIAELHKELVKTEESARNYVSFSDRVIQYERIANRLKDSIQKEREAFSENLSKLNTAASPVNKLPQ